MVREGLERWVDPQPAPGSEPAPLAKAQVESWRERGFALVTGLLDPSDVEQLRLDGLAYFPAADTAEAKAMNHFGSSEHFVFPSASEAMNRIALHPRLLAACAQLMGVPIFEMRLTQSDLWPKYGHAASSENPLDNSDQRIHVDYPNHTLVHPPRWDEPEAVELIVYLSDEAECGGATAVVPRQGRDDPAYPWPIVRTPGVAGMPYINERTAAESYLAKHHPKIAAWRRNHLYAREVGTRYRVGSVLLYRHDTWHRGTPIKSGALRLAMNLTYRKAGRDWMGVLHQGWSWAMYRRSQVMERLVASSSPEQRAVLGFPKPGHPYWNEDTLAAVEARYANFGIDMSPYREALNARRCDIASQS